MTRILVLTITALLVGDCTRAWADLFGSGANSFDIEFVPIGNPGNAADTGDGDSGQSGLQRFGGVDYAYRMAKFEISEGMIDAGNALSSLGFTHDNRGPDKPATSLRWHQMARFVNWLNISEGYGPAYKFNGPLPGEPSYNPIGVSADGWAPGDPGYDPANPYRNRRAKYVLPTNDEWYKAAYYDRRQHLLQLFHGERQRAGRLRFPGRPQFRRRISRQ